MISRTSMRRFPRRMPRRNKVNMVRYKFIVQEEWKLITLVSLFLSGMIIGSISVRNMDSSINSKLVSMFTDFVLLRSTNSILDTFLNSFSVSFLYLFLAYIFGTCAIGIPVITIIPLCRGISLGMVAGYFYSTYALTGAGYCMVIIFPAAIISTVALLYGCNESLLMSHNIFYAAQGKAQNQYENSFKRYTGRYFILTLFILVASVLDTLLTVLFASKFNLG